MTLLHQQELFKYITTHGRMGNHMQLIAHMLPLIVEKQLPTAHM